MKVGFRVINMRELWENKVYLPYYSVVDSTIIRLYCPVNKRYVPVNEILTNKAWSIDLLLVRDFKNDSVYENDIVQIDGENYDVEFNDRELRVEGKKENGEIIFGEILNRGTLIDNVYLRRLRAAEWTHRKE